jgi:hypothetical protein
LPSVFVKQRNYRMDSIQNRLDYEKVFNYKKPGFSTSLNPNPGGTAGVGVDLDELINMFKFRKNKRMVASTGLLLNVDIYKYKTPLYNNAL